MDPKVLIAALAILAAGALAASVSPGREGLTEFSDLEAGNVVVRDGNNVVIYNTANNKGSAKNARLGNGVKCTRTKDVIEELQYKDTKLLQADLKTMKEQLANANTQLSATKGEIDALTAKIKDLEKALGQ